MSIVSASMASSLAFLLLLAVSAAALHHMPASGNGGFSVDLIHRDSPKSPLHDPDSTPFSRISAAAGSSRARAAYFLSRISMTSSSSSPNEDGAVTDFYSGITPVNNSAYLMHLMLGTPETEIVVVLDTGSDLNWVNCKPCHTCHHHNAAIFKPRASSTYKAVSCHADNCLLLEKHASCTRTSKCQYRYGYGDGSVVEGLLSTETLRFDSTGGHRVEFPMIRFGCTHRIKGTTFNQLAVSGIVSLGGGKLSLIRQLGSAIGSKFSYCLPSFLETSAKGRLNFGSSAIVSGPNSVTTPLIPTNYDTFYVLHLEQIIVAGKAIAVKASEKLGGGRGNIIIDSGTTLTLIDDASTLKAVARKVARSTKLPQVKDPNESFVLCFDVSGVKHYTKLFPELTFRFSGGASLVLPIENAYVLAAENTACLGLISSGDIGVNIFGNIAQQNFHIGYDLESMKLTFAPADCANL
ncbi:Aspartic proteinase CDR1 [Apostasia shenzhenica]|uniref:Aspartic proteinase CDR1 n=1 Tax=Apostasia shenzhenica TaxID=1088818 RepID=A0A2I0A3K5_9ASPA|nr:Aspartic proteinase CDR1 [Apostasia shenzhenica]